MNFNFRWKQEVTKAWYLEKILNLDFKGIRNLDSLCERFGFTPEFIEGAILGKPFKEVTGSKGIRNVAGIVVDDNYYETGITSLKELIKEVEDVLKKHPKSNISVHIGYEQVIKGDIVDEDYDREIILIQGD